MFLLNLECPLGEVDIMAEPEKTWVEFADWLSARNVCIAMLLVSTMVPAPQSAQGQDGWITFLAVLGNVRLTHGALWLVDTCRYCLLIWTRMLNYASH